MGRAGYLGLGAVWLLALPFVAYAAAFGWRGLVADPGAESYLFDTGARGAEVALAAHMLAGALITALVPIQVLPVLRRRWPGLHRAAGRVIAGAAGMAALGGLAFIAVQGTIGGAVMDLGFGLYGALMLLAAVQAVRRARARDLAGHQIWALRLAVLAMASWAYRVHYGLWYALTGGLGSNEAFTGAFDRVQVFAFFLPYLLLVELWRLRRGAGAC
ncbi:DUF2306 domain-containing protein [Dinoroseobacter sp. PD6]|uniref:DUF2306 domain-containing protein n=1 Tax=Dinoroseobacter sp. PD6 TaxID=3028384 RepID=UPI00237BEB79|nr:DUF2306 domain-containing protein [Dinoroseobacter sp. PD6]MDD9718284.1 DUF2306 domain-containing protein [Dinoroseobacter sp. PD6]